MNYHQTAFTEAVKKEQQKQGSYEQYARVRERMDREGLGPAERDFIESRDSFYLATIGQNGFPYIQHRGGPAGFLKVIDDETLGFIDFAGNRQYISLGNLADRDEVSLFLMDYPHKTRLKIYARAKVLSIAENPELYAQLDPVDYKHRSERIMLFKVEAFDWNCPQHITPRFTEAEVKALLAE